MAKPLSQQEVEEMHEEDLEHLIVEVPGLSVAYCSEDLNCCFGCEQYIVETLDGLGLCEHCSYDHAIEMEHIQSLMRRYREDAL